MEIDNTDEPSPKKAQTSDNEKSTNHPLHIKRNQVLKPQPMLFLRQQKKSTNILCRIPLNLSQTLMLIKPPNLLRAVWGALCKHHR